jgi:hypothetical protein
VLVRDSEVVGSLGGLDEERLHRMLSRGVAALMETDSGAEGWGRLVRPGEVVGVKSNQWEQLPTPRPLERAIRRELRARGVAKGDLAIDDRGARHSALFRRATSLINVRPLRVHYWAGLGTCLKNYISFVPRPADYHGDSCADLGAIWRLPHIAGKTRLNILVLLTPQFHGVGPHGFSRRFTWPYGGLLLGTDPVAVDSVGARLIEAKRELHFGGKRPLSPPAHHIRVADHRYGLGISDPERIDLVRLGWTEEALI